MHEILSSGRNWIRQPRKIFPDSGWRKLSITSNLVERKMWHTSVPHATLYLAHILHSIRALELTLDEYITNFTCLTTKLVNFYHAWTSTQISTEKTR